MKEEIKTKVERCKRIKLYPMIKSLSLDGLAQFSWESGFDICLKLEKIEKRNFIKFIYRSYDEQGNIEQYNYSVRLTKTKCQIAGWRYWFACPILKANEKPCHRRVSVLYKPPARKCFGCRRCHNLIYQSQCLSRLDKKCGRIISPFDIQDQENSFRKRYHHGIPTRRYGAFLHKSVKNHFRMQNHNQALMDRLSNK